MTDTRLRVKVFTRGQDRLWEDRGIGHVSSGCVEGLRGTFLLVRAESDDVDKIVGAPLGRKEKSTMISGSLLLESKINPNTNYRKGQYTILWCEAENYDLALSFQENAGCDEFWEKICQVLGRDPWEEDAHFLEEELEEEECSGDLSSLVPFALTPEF